jgi:hypothetical protein
MKLMTEKIYYRRYILIAEMIIANIYGEGSNELKHMSDVNTIFLYNNAKARLVREISTVYDRIKEKIEEENLEIFEQLMDKPHDVLVDIAFKLVEENNTCDNGGYNYWIDKQGCHTVSLTDD